MSDGRREAWDDDTRAYRESVVPGDKQGLDSDPGATAIAATSPGEMDTLVLGVLTSDGQQAWAIETQVCRLRPGFGALGDVLGSAVRASLARLVERGAAIRDSYRETTSGQDEWRIVNKTVDAGPART